MSKVYEIESPYSGKQKVFIEKSEYLFNKALALKLVCKDGSPWGMLTVNLDGYKLKKNLAFVDTNNIPYAEDFIKKYNLGKYIGVNGFSGFCEYPIYDFTSLVEELERER